MRGGYSCNQQDIVIFLVFFLALFKASVPKLYIVFELLAKFHYAGVWIRMKN